MSDHSYTLSNPGSDLKIEVLAARWYYIEETGEKVLWPEYIEVDKKYFVDPDAEFVEIIIRIKNPNKVWYQVSSVVSSERAINPETNGWNSRRESLYEGQLRYKLIVMQPLVEEKMLHTNYILVTNEKGLTIMRIGDFKFIGQKGGDNP